jgi:hypothetical protein
MQARKSASSSFGWGAWILWLFYTGLDLSAGWILASLTSTPGDGNLAGRAVHTVLFISAAGVLRWIVLGGRLERGGLCVLTKATIVFLSFAIGLTAILAETLAPGSANLSNGHLAFLVIAGLLFAILTWFPIAWLLPAGAGEG